MNMPQNPIEAILARALYIALSVAHWKRHTVFANLEHVKLKTENPKAFYKALLKSLSKTAATFLCGNRKYKQLPKDISQYPCRSKAHDFFISKNSAKNILEMQKGGIFLAAHYGNYEAIGAWLLCLGVPLKASYARIKPKFLNNILETKLRAVNGKGYSTFVDNPRNVLDMLKQGKLFCLVADQDFRRPSAIQGEFLDQKVNCNPLLAFLLKHRPEAPVYFCNIRTTQNSTELEVKKLKDSSAMHAEDVYAAYHRELEQLIAIAPEHWYGFTHRRFKANAPSLYNK